LDSEEGIICPSQSNGHTPAGLPSLPRPLKGLPHHSHVCLDVRFRRSSIIFRISSSKVGRQLAGILSSCKITKVPKFQSLFSSISWVRLHFSFPNPKLLVQSKQNNNVVLVLVDTRQKNNPKKHPTTLVPREKMFPQDTAQASQGKSRGR
jgi:hypothetical protein